MIKLLFKGNVQGVGFRATTLSFGEKLNLTLTATNLPNGDVEVIIEKASSDQISKLIENLKQSFLIISVSENY